jgi:hypothetical protein
MKIQVVESKLFIRYASASDREAGDPTIPVSPIMLLKTNGVKMSVSGLAIMLMKTQIDT